MEERAKPKRKYTRRRKVEPLAVYAVVVTVKSGRKTETIYAESTRVENGCLVIVSMDGPQPLVERTRYIPFGSAEIEVCNRPRQQNLIPWAAYQNSVGAPSMKDIEQMQGWQARAMEVAQPGPRIEEGPLETARRMAHGAPRVAPTRPTAIVERNHEGLPVVMGGFTDSGGNF